jgi:CheY-like chemotaxis protein
VKTILIVDDELASAEALALILEDQGYRVACAANGQQGLDKVAQIKPDLVILDLMMPVMDGADMGRALRASDETRGIKIIMNSALSEAALRQRFADYDAFLRKPYTIDRLLAHVAASLRA